MFFQSIPKPLIDNCLGMMSNFLHPRFYYRNDRICNLVRIMTSTHFVTAFLSQKSTFFDFLLVTGPYTNLTLQKIKLSNRGFYLGRYGILSKIISEYESRDLTYYISLENTSCWNNIQKIRPTSYISETFVNLSYCNEGSNSAAHYIYIVI